MRITGHRKIWLTTGIICTCLLFCYAFCLPRNLFGHTSYSTVVTDKDGELLGARIADDGQWRFPPNDTVPDKFAKALIEFEDKYFRWHPGVNLGAIARATWQNLSKGKIISGGSTITMQVIRMSRDKERNLWQKFIEAILATRLEIRHTKDEIIALYASHAPFGGNVVGLEAAAWRYFGTDAASLSWGESALLAVLPNSPGIMHPGKNRDLLKSKRDRLLEKLYRKGELDSVDFVLACEEPLPLKPLPLPQYAPHIIDYCHLNHKGRIIRTDIDIDLQKNCERIAQRWNDKLAMQGIGDLAFVIMDVNTGKTIAFGGNTGFGSGREGSQVNAATALRSTGSILKPILYCAMLENGDILPRSLLPDIPINLDGFSPQNFDRKFYGAVPADEALTRSLNVPSVHSLRKFGVQKFHTLLQKAGMTSLGRPSSDYGLSLILGGAEGRLTEITAIYARLARTANGLENEAGFPLKNTLAALYTMNALREVNRPDEINWKNISSARQVAWKTGTSFGFRDAWAVGTTPDYTIGVWAGNASGEGSPGLTGASTAGPVMFDLFNLLPESQWFEEYLGNEFVNSEVCRESGYLKGPYCADCDTLILPKAALKSSPCPYHQSNGDFQLPAAMQWYRYKTNKGQKSRTSSPNSIQFIYPESGQQIYIPIQMDGTRGEMFCHAAHNDLSATIYWHLDEHFIGQTDGIHKLSLSPKPGRHQLTIVDSAGNSASVSFTILDKNRN